MKNESTAPKTIREWLTELDEPWRTEALENVNSPYHLDRKVNSLFDAVYEGVYWGNDFMKWRNFYKKLKLGEDIHEITPEPTPPDLHALLKEILAERHGGNVSTDHIKAVFAKHGVIIDNEK